jgi:hypothetical protein
MKKSLGFRNSSHGRQGIALVTVLIMLVMITTLVTVSTLLALANRGSSTDTIQQTRAQNLAEAGIEKALDTVFYETYRRWVIGGEGGSGVKFDLCSFKKWLTGYWSGSSITAQKDTTKIAANNNDTCFASSSVNAAIPDRTKTDVTAPTIPDLLNGVKVVLPDITKATLGDLSADGLDYKVSVSVTRNDTSSNSDIVLTFVSTSVVLNGTQEIAAKKITRSMNLAGSPFPGNEFALLTNDINCSFCHLQIDNMQRVYADPTSTDIFKRVKLGSLSKTPGFKFDNAGHKNDSLIAGTLYSRGTVVPPTNDTTNYFAPWVDAAHPGFIKIGTNNAIGGSLTTSLYAAGAAASAYDPAANPTDTLAIDGSDSAAQAKGKVYYNYPAATKPAPDGILPDEFPQIVDDTNSDGLISDDEWTNYMAGAPRGSLIANGAIVYGVSRPGFVGSTKIGGNIPVSYDPIAANSGTYSGTRLGDKFLAGSIWNGINSGRPARAVGNDMTIAELQADITQLNLLTNIWAISRSNIDFNNMTAAETRFKNQWLGWLLQQALSSPNNRDLRPTNTTADVNNLTAFTPVFGPNVNGLAQNNFWTAYDPVLGNFYLSYCRTDPCQILTAAPNATNNPENGVRNSSIIPGVDALAPDIAVLTLPMVDTNLFPQVSNDAKDDLSSGLYSGTSGLFNGNLIIDAGRIGSSNISISVTGTIHVNGDLVIRGQVKGEARFIVRGNVYVVGDVVYGCETTACKIVDGTKPSYRIPKELPKLALLAGGSIIVGDYDHTDFRANRSQLNLINDQVGQNRQPTAGATTAANTSWNMLTVPGATGTNMTDNRTNGSSGNMGFVPMMAAFGNNHSNVRFASAPFGFMVARAGGFGAYENGGTKINSLGSYSIQTLYPSNGQLKIGGNTQNGFGVAPNAAGVISNAALRCLNAAMSPIPTVFDANLKSLNAGFWCAPTEKSVRNWNTTGPTPANAATTTWMNQPTSNAGLDGGIGMTTGWLGGLLRTGLVGTGFDQLGDLSQTKLLKLFWLSTMESTADRDPNIANMQSVGPLRTDGMFYSRNSLFCVARYYQDQLSRSDKISNTQARWIHNGSVLSFELGFLLTGDVTNSASQFTTIRNTPIDFTPAVSPATNKGPSMGVFYDDRLSGILGLTGGGLEIRRTGVFSQTGR